MALASDGAHLPATLFHLANATNGASANSEAVYAEVANRLSQLIDDVRRVHVDRDERRQLLTIYATGRDGTSYPARALSDGTLRFLALSVLSIEPDPHGVICMEEPENGIHPERIPAMIQLLRDLTTDDQEHVDIGEHVRQVIINTHSPAVVMQVPDDSLVIAECVDMNQGQGSFKALQLGCLQGTWREKSGAKPTAKGKLLAYLNPVAIPEPVGPLEVDGLRVTLVRRRRRVIDREDVNQYRIPFAEISG